MFKIFCPLILINLKNRLGRQLLPSTDRNFVLGRTSVRCSGDIGDSLLFFVYALDCTKQATFTISFIYFNSSNVSSINFPSTDSSHLRFFEFTFPCSKPEKPIFVLISNSLKNRLFSHQFWILNQQCIFPHRFCIINQKYKSR